MALQCRVARSLGCTHRPRTPLLLVELVVELVMVRMMMMKKVSRMVKVVKRVVKRRRRKKKKKKKSKHTRLHEARQRCTQPQRTSDHQKPAR